MDFFEVNDGGIITSRSGLVDLLRSHRSAIPLGSRFIPCGKTVCSMFECPTRHSGVVRLEPARQYRTPATQSLISPRLRPMAAVRYAELRRRREAVLSSLRCQPFREHSAGENLAIRHPFPYVQRFPYAIIEDGFSHAGVCQSAPGEETISLTVRSERWPGPQCAPEMLCLISGFLLLCRISDSLVPNQRFARKAGVFSQSRDGFHP